MIDESFQIYIVQITQKCIYEISTHFWHDLIISPSMLNNLFHKFAQKSLLRYLPWKTPFKKSLSII